MLYSCLITYIYVCVEEVSLVYVSALLTEERQRETQREGVHKFFCVCACVCSALRGQKVSPGTEVVAGCELLDMGTWNQTCVLW